MHRRQFLKVSVTALACNAAPLLAADPPPPIEVRLDVSETPELKEWGEKAQKLCKDWYPKIADRLSCKDRPRPVAIVFKKNMKGIAHTANDTITISGEWIKKHPDDYGMVIHELTHVVQAYPANDAGWLVEGIADYIRYHYFEPKRNPPRVTEKSSYKEGYGTAAAFLAWIEQAHSPKLVPKLNTALHEGKYRPEIFKEATGKELEELWKEYVKARAKE